MGIKDAGDGASLAIDSGIPQNIKPKLADWLDSIIPQLVEPPLPKLSTCLIHPRKNKSQIAPGNVLIAVHIPESDAAPHQAMDHKYYQRVGRRLQPLKHRAIVDIAGRRRFPKLRTTVFVYTGGGLAKPAMFWKVENLGLRWPLRWMAMVKFPTAINGKSVCFADEKPITGGNRRRKILSRA